MKNYRVTKYYTAKAVCFVSAEDEEDALERFEEHKAKIELIQETEEPEIKEVTE